MENNNVISEAMINICKSVISYVGNNCSMPNTTIMCK